MSAGLTRPAATRFSFLLALPALVGATVVSAPDLAGGDAMFSTPAIIAGILAAFLSGYLAIRWLLALVARDRLTGFAWYCFAVGGLSLVAIAAGR
jgi:undecaprenyl-diphosphatase